MSKSKNKNLPTKKTKTEKLFSNKEYNLTLAKLKKTIQECQVKAITAANKEMIRLYWMIGETIADKQKKSRWGTSVIEKLGKDLQNAFPGIEGFSKRNVFRMRAFYQAYEKVPQAVAQLDDLPVFHIPWGHNILILEKIKDTAEPAIPVKISSC